jgi:PhnB protein
MQLNTYLLFDGNCEEAFHFYTKNLGGKVQSLMRFESSPAAADVPPDWQRKVLHARIRIGDVVLMASDAPPGRYSVPKGFAVTLGTDTPEEAERLFKVLASGGQVGMPLEKTFFAERFGMVIDRFGTPWMVSCERPA